MTTRQRFLTLSVTALALVGVIAHVLAAPPPGKGKLKLALTVTVTPTSIKESGEPNAATGTVTHNNADLSSEVVVTLSSSDPTEATVPASVEIPADSNSATFPITAVDDSQADGDQTVTITATATDYRSATATLTVEDADSSPPATQPSYSITLLGTLGGPDSIAQGINIHGDVVGYSHAGDGTMPAFLYTAEDGMRDLHDLIDPDSGWVLLVGRDINDSGQIVGVGYLNGVGRAFRYTPGASPLVKDLGTLGGATSAAYAVNNAGDVAGVADAADGTRRAFIYIDVFDTMVDIGDLGGNPNGARGINNFMQATGAARVNGLAHAFRFTLGADGLEDLGVLKNGPTASSVGLDLNDSGQVVGSSYAGRFKRHAFRYTDGLGMVDLGTLGGQEDKQGQSKATGINWFGDVVGVADLDGDVLSHPFLYTDEFGMLDLQLSITNLSEQGLAGERLDLQDLKINDWGEICGTARQGHSGKPYEAYLLTPTP